MRPVQLIIRGVLARWGEDDAAPLETACGVVRAQAAALDAAGLRECFEAVLEHVAPRPGEKDEEARRAALRFVEALAQGAAVTSEALTGGLVRRIVACVGGGDDAASASAGALVALIRAGLAPDALHELAPAALADAALARAAASLGSLEVYGALVDRYGRAETGHATARAEEALVPILAHARRDFRFHAAHALSAAWRDDRRAALPAGLKRLCDDLADSIIVVGDPNNNNSNNNKNHGHRHHRWTKQQDDLGSSTSTLARCLQLQNRLDGCSQCIGAVLAWAATPPPSNEAMMRATHHHNKKSQSSKDGSVALDAVLALVEALVDASAPAANAPPRAPHLQLARPAIRDCACDMLTMLLGALGPLAKRDATRLYRATRRLALSAGAAPAHVRCLGALARCLGCGGGHLFFPEAVEALSKQVLEATRSALEPPPPPPAAARTLEGAAGGDEAPDSSSKPQHNKDHRGRKRRRKGGTNNCNEGGEHMSSTSLCKVGDLAVAQLATLATVMTHCGSTVGVEARATCEATLLVELARRFIALHDTEPAFRLAILDLAAACLVAPLPATAARSRLALEASKDLTRLALRDPHATVLDAATRLDGLVATVLRPRCVPLRRPVIADHPKRNNPFSDDDDDDDDYNDEEDGISAREEEAVVDAPAAVPEPAAAATEHHNGDDAMMDDAPVADGNEKPTEEEVKEEKATHLIRRRAEAAPAAPSEPSPAPAPAAPEPATAPEEPAAEKGTSAQRPSPENTEDPPPKPPRPPPLDDDDDDDDFPEIIIAD